MSKLQCIPLGGLGEIGKNCMAMQYEDDIIILDCGSAFPDESTPGVDRIIPDFRWLVERREKLRALIVTHGHEDHIGAIPYLLREFPDLPVHTGRLTAGLIAGKLEEYQIDLSESSQIVAAGDVIQCGRHFRVEFLHTTHSIPDSFSLAIHTPVGTVIFTGDFKFDPTPIDERPADQDRLRELGDQGVLALFADSTNAERPGRTPSERGVGERLAEIVAQAEGRVIIASFASNVHRVQQAIHAAVKAGRKVALAGRSMERTVEIAAHLGHIKAPEGTIVPIEELRTLPLNQQLLLTTGSQGEPGSGLTRLAQDAMRGLTVTPGDLVVFAATPIPGNEGAVARTVDNLMRRGVKVLYQRDTGVHVSGHASQDEQAEMIALVRPRFFIPVHGEYRMLVKHAELARSQGVPRTLIGENGDIFEFDRKGGKIARRLDLSPVYIDGDGVDDVGALVLRDRLQIGQEGIVIISLVVDGASGLAADVSVHSRGFISVAEASHLMPEIRAEAVRVIESVMSSGAPHEMALKAALREEVGRLIRERTRRRPLIMTLIHRS